MACKAANLYYLPCYYDDFRQFDGWAIGTYAWLDRFATEHIAQGFCTYSDSSCILLKNYVSAFAFYGFSFYSPYPVGEFMPGFAYSVNYEFATLMNGNYYYGFHETYWFIPDRYHCFAFRFLAIDSDTRWTVGDTDSIWSIA